MAGERRRRRQFRGGHGGRLRKLHRPGHGFRKRKHYRHRRADGFARSRTTPRPWFRSSLPGQFTCPFELGQSAGGAILTIYLPAPGKVVGAIWHDHRLWPQHLAGAHALANGGDVQIYVAGMLGETLYHMRGQVTLNNGATYNGADHTCTTDLPPAHFARSGLHTRRSDAATGHRDVEHHSSHRRQPGLRHRSQAAM